MIPMSTAPTTTSARPRPPFQERLWPLLYRRLSLVYYRRSERFARHCARVGPQATQPVPPLADVLAVYLAQRLPAQLVSRLGCAGLFRSAKICAVLLTIAACCCRPLLWLAKALFRGLKWLRHPNAAGAGFVHHPPVGNASLVMGGCVRFCGFTYANDRLNCYFQRIRPTRNHCRVVVRAHPGAPDVQSSACRAGGSICREHDLLHPLPTWPRHGVYRDETCLADLPPGDYRMEVSLFDLTAHQCLSCDENGRTSIDLGWIRVRGTRSSALDPAAEGGAHAAD